MLIAPGSTSVSVDVFFADDTGAAVTGKVAADFPACKWSSGTNTADTTITLSDLAAITTAHPNDNTAGGIKEREGGWYRLDLPNNMLTSAGRKILTFVETTNKRILAPQIDVQYAQADVRQLLGTAWLTPGTAGTPDVNVKLWNALTTVALPLVPTVAGRTLDVAATGEAGLDFDNIKDATGAHTLTNIRIPNVTLTDTLTTYTGNTVQTGDVYGRIGVTGGLPNTIVRAGTAQAGNANSLTLDASASATTDLYKGCLLTLTAGTGAGQTRTVTGYNGTTKAATVDRAWTTTPTNGTSFSLLATDNPSLNANLQVTSNTSTAPIRTGTAQAGASASITLDAFASSTNNIYTGNIIALTGGTGLGQSRTIISYNGSTKVATVDRAWNVTPDNTTAFSILASTTASQFSDQGLAQAGGASSITLASTASATSNLYVGSLVTILSGTGSGQTREITAYNGTTKVTTVDSAWDTPPDSTSGYAVIPAAGTDIATTPATPTTADIADKILGRNLAGSSDGGRTVRDALRLSRNRWTRNSGALTVYTEDDTTIAWTSVITLSAVNPVTESDPA